VSEPAAPTLLDLDAALRRVGCEMLFLHVHPGDDSRPAWTAKATGARAPTLRVRGATVGEALTTLLERALEVAP
jgi:hypothetical protein